MQNIFAVFSIHDKILLAYSIQRQLHIRVTALPPYKPCNTFCVFSIYAKNIGVFFNLVKYFSLSEYAEYAYEKRNLTFQQCLMTLKGLYITKNRTGDYILAG
jgi:hypothetical protein